MKTRSQPSLPTGKTLKYYSNYLLVATVFVYLLQACGTTGTAAPLNERAAALATILFSQNTGAEKLAPNYFSSANDYFTEGDRMIVRDENSEQNITAREAFLQAHAEGETAIQITLHALIVEVQTIVDQKDSIAQGSGQLEILTAAENHLLAAANLITRIQYEASLDEIIEARRLLASIQPNAAADAAIRSYTVILNTTDRDTLRKIAREQLHDASRWREIYELNKDTVSDPDLIYPHQVIKLPK